MIKKKFINYFIPIFLFSYFALAYLPVFDLTNGEFFPFFTFNLYSSVPDGFTTYDLLVYAQGKPAYLFVRKNNSLNKLERKRYRNDIYKLGKRFEESGQIILGQNIKGIIKGDSVFLVRVSGDYIRAVKNNKYKVIKLKKLK